jgi:hypothetical protein
MLRGSHKLLAAMVACAAVSAALVSPLVGGAEAHASTTQIAPKAAVAHVKKTNDHGYWLVGHDGGIFSFGQAAFYGSTGNLRLQRPVVGITPTMDHKGYWLVGSDGGVFAFGNAGYYGSIPGLGIAPAGSRTEPRLNAGIVGIVPSADGRGYFMVAADGGVFAFGDAQFEGSCPGIGGCGSRAVAVVPDGTGHGYWLVTAQGHVQTFGNAHNYGQPGRKAVPIASAARTANGGGYWILYRDGVVFRYGNAENHGSLPEKATHGYDVATTIFPTADDAGYWIATSFGAVYPFGDAPALGDMAGHHLNGFIIGGVGW